MKAITFVTVGQLGTIDGTVSSGDPTKYPVNVPGVSFLTDDSAVNTAWLAIQAAGSFTDGNGNLVEVSQAAYYQDVILTVNGAFNGGNLVNTTNNPYLKPTAGSSTGSFDFTGDVSADGNLTIDGNGTIGGTFGVTGNTTLGGTLGVTGNVAVATNKFTVTAASGNTAVAGTLAVTGAATLSSTLAVTGAITGSSTIAGTAGTLSATTNQLVLGTTNTTTITSPAPSASRTYTLPDAGGAAKISLYGETQLLTGGTSDKAVTKPGGKSGVCRITKSSAASDLTMAVGTDVTDDGKEVVIYDSTGHAHVVTSGTDGFDAKGSSGTLTFDGTVGSFARILFDGGHLWVVASSGVTKA